jgi:tellurite resistance protein TehA-like permease
MAPLMPAGSSELRSGQPYPLSRAGRIVGDVSWSVLSPIVRLRLFTSPALPVPLRSTLAIELAPPVIAKIAWFELNAGQVDPIAFILAGYAFLMVLGRPPMRRQRGDGRQN